MFSNLFGKKKDVAPSTVSATSVARPEDPQNTIVKLRDAITNQEKRYVVKKNEENDIGTVTNLLFSHMFEMANKIAPDTPFSVSFLRYSSAIQCFMIKLLLLSSLMKSYQNTYTAILI
jgi:hypothetical protein